MCIHVYEWTCMYVCLHERVYMNGTLLHTHTCMCMRSCALECLEQADAADVKLTSTCHGLAT
jgi:hypothetical protein